MNEDPIQFDNDELGCPRCKTPLTEGKSPFYHHEIKVGSFDSLRCDFCGYFVLTERGFRESTKAIIQHGLTEPIRDFTAIVDNTIKLFYPNASEIMSNHISVEKLESETSARNSTVTRDEAATTPLLTTKYKFLKK